MNEDLNQKAIFIYLEQPNQYLAMMEGKGHIKLDPILCVRENLIQNGKLYFNGQMNSDLLIEPLNSRQYSLNIPAKFAVKYGYAEKNLDYEHDYALIHQFSPLLSTKTKDIYYMEHYFWSNTCSATDNRCVRMLIRHFLEFEIKNKKVKYLSTISLQNQVDFIGFGGFSRNKMIEALPAEQIDRFGW